MSGEAEWVERNRGEWTGTCRTCAIAHPAHGCADVECTHNCQREVYAQVETAR